MRSPPRVTAPALLRQLRVVPSPRQPLTARNVEPLHPTGARQPNPRAQADETKTQSRQEQCRQEPKHPSWHGTLQPRPEIENRSNRLSMGKRRAPRSRVALLRKKPSRHRLDAPRRSRGKTKAHCRSRRKVNRRVVSTTRGYPKPRHKRVAIPTNEYLQGPAKCSSSTTPNAVSGGGQHAALLGVGSHTQ